MKRLRLLLGWLMGQPVQRCCPHLPRHLPLHPLGLPSARARSERAAPAVWSRAAGALQQVPGCLLGLEQLPVIVQLRWLRGSGACA